MHALVDVLPDLVAEIAAALASQGRGDLARQLEGSEVSDDEARWTTAYDVARQIVDGQLKPLDGATKLWQIAIDLGVPDSLAPFVYLASDYGEGTGTREEEEAWFDAEIVAKARKLLAHR